MLGPEEILRGVRLPVARIFTLVPPTSMTSTLLELRYALPSYFSRGGVHCRPDVLLVMSSSHFRPAAERTIEIEGCSADCNAGCWMLYRRYRVVYPPLANIV